MRSQPKTMLVSRFLHLGRKRETEGNQSGNGQETKLSSLCRNGNEVLENIGNKKNYNPEDGTIGNQSLVLKNLQKNSQRMTIFLKTIRPSF